MNESLRVNGAEHPMPKNANIIALLYDLGLEGKPVIVEHNKTALFPRDYQSTEIHYGDSIEVITIAAGG